MNPLDLVPLPMPDLEILPLDLVPLPVDLVPLEIPSGGVS